MAHVEKSVTMQQSFEEFSEKQRRVELKSVGNFVAKKVLIESATQFSLEELCSTQYSLKYFSKPYRPSDPLENLNRSMVLLRILLCFTGMAEQELQRISSSLYALLSSSVGSEEIIGIRRTTTYLQDYLHKIDSDLNNKETVSYYSGSKGEGLRFKSSDDDWMRVYKTIKVIPSFSNMTIHNNSATLLLMENEMTKPGFTLLRLTSKFANRKVARSNVAIENRLYLSSRRWRALHTSLGPHPYREFTHGPCTSGIGFSRGYEYDIAFCLRCEFWPRNALGCIKRLRQCHWPSADIVLKIINDGVLFVAIGAKKSYFENIEWRMSFSLAEQKLIFAMNPTQFRCYGLFKIFLKEAIDVCTPVKGLLCSYFMKTVIFWEITLSPTNWNPSTLLVYFWRCFCRLLQWVNFSYCPNFFIPENNMFEGKIEGANREKLMQHLNRLYCDGYICLLRCPSLPTVLRGIVHNSDMYVVEKKTSRGNIAVSILRECDNAHRVFSNVGPLCLFLYWLASHATNSLPKFILQNWLYRWLTSFSISNTCHISRQDLHNKVQYKKLTETMTLLSRCHLDSVTHILYQTILCYNAGKCCQALRLLQKAKKRILSPDCMYSHTISGRWIVKKGLSLEATMRRHLLDNIVLNCDFVIPELYIERRGSCVDFTIERLFIPPLVSALFLQYLCQRRLGRLRKANEATYELSLLVQYDNGKHIPDEDDPLGISWQILGICQQMSGNDQAACQSYLRVLRQDKYLRKVATYLRLGMILVKYIHS